MKKLIFLLLAATASVSLSAQVFRLGALDGAAWGAIAGAVIGHNSGSLGHNAWRGAAYGALAGAVIGDLADNHHHSRTQVPYPRHARHQGYDYGYRHVYAEPVFWPGYAWSRYDYGYPSYGYADYGYDDGYYGPADGTANGMILGSIAGAIIGRNSGSLGHSAWRGAAYGALAGTVLGAIHDAHTPRAPRRVVIPARDYESEAEAAPTAAPAQAPVTIINNYYVTTPMSSANALFGRH